MTSAHVNPSVHVTVTAETEQPVAVESDTGISANQQQLRVQWLFRQHCLFVKSCSTIEDAPQIDIPEVAFIGRSNVGKSSLINTLVGQKNLVKTSKTPGRTQSLNYFSMGNLFHIVDSPGYGYAKAPKSAVLQWIESMKHYLKNRENIRMAFLLLDARRRGDLKVTDKRFIRFLKSENIPFTIVLTKVDRVTRRDVTVAHYKLSKLFADSTNSQQQPIEDETAEDPVPEPRHKTVPIIQTSARDKIGIDELRTAIAACVGMHTIKKAMRKLPVMQMKLQIEENRRHQKKLTTKQQEQRQSQEQQQETIEETAAPSTSDSTGRTEASSKKQSRGDTNKAEKPISKSNPFVFRSKFVEQEAPRSQKGVEALKMMKRRVQRRADRQQMKDDQKQRKLIVARYKEQRSLKALASGRSKKAIKPRNQQKK